MTGESNPQLLTIPLGSFPNREACLRLVTALCVEQSEEWVTGRRYLDMRELEERPKEKRKAEEVMLMQY